MRSVPTDEERRQGALVAVDRLRMYFPTRQGIFLRGSGLVRAVENVSFTIERGETLGLVGETGSGKTTLGRCLVRLYRPTAGSILFGGQEIAGLNQTALRPLRPHIQLIFQDPYASLNPRMTVGGTLREHLSVQHFGTRRQIEERVAELVEQVGLPPHFSRRYPHELSGGQRQRVVIARAISTNPQFIVADEPVAALDVSIRAQIINLLRQLQKQLHLTYMFISHDLSVVRHISQRIAVMYLGHIVELADRHLLYQMPLHPYTQSLLSAVPIPDPAVEAHRRRVILHGDLPSPANPPPGCVFHTRCPAATDRCRLEVPPLREIRTGQRAACHYAGEVDIRNG